MSASPASRRRLHAPLLADPALSGAERAYVRLFGAPVLGLRIRARYLLPLIDELAGRPLARIADAGCGRGLFTFHLARAFPRASVLGLDLDAAQVERNRTIAERLGVENCAFEVRDVATLDREPGFDLVLSADNLEHLEDDRGQCRVFYRALAPGGRLLVHAPHETRDLFGWKRRNFMDIEGHVRPGYTLPGLAGMLEAEGFAIDRARYSYGWVETLANDLSYLITGGRERRKPLYALCFPWLLLLSRLGGGAGARGGSGVAVLARRPAGGAA